MINAQLHSLLSHPRSSTFAAAQMQPRCSLRQTYLGPRHGGQWIIYVTLQEGSNITVKWDHSPASGIGPLPGAKRVTLARVPP